MIIILTVMMICSRDDDSPLVTHYDDDLIIIFFAFTMYFIVACLYVLTIHVTVCVCHAELKDYLHTRTHKVCNTAYLGYVENGEEVSRLFQHEDGLFTNDWFTATQHQQCQTLHCVQCDTVLLRLIGRLSHRLFTNHLRLSSHTHSLHQDSPPPDFPAGQTLHQQATLPSPVT